MRFATFAIAATVFGQTILAIPLDPEISDGAIGSHEPRNDGAFFKGLDVVDLDNAEANPNKARFQRGISTTPSRTSFTRI
ncbi:hypothetical protein BN946_scf185042.g26 [Trametes cinnabarina]|uniref:Uncharacterized protein n=1 Tax=Pycnoporus cinnabarinus TaxID=5643 RepID=A0A060SA03_PYCCI|nr:hypothetical protein BN946_scf185042.g26 [Trametes cinnabarina]